MKKKKIVTERRKNVRFRVFSLIKHAVEPDLATFRTENVRDVSRGGLAFCTEQEIKEGSILTLHFLPPNCAKPVLVRGKVVRCPKTVFGVRTFEIGIQFLDLSEEAKRAIGELETFFLENQKKKRR